MISLKKIHPCFSFAITLFWVLGLVLVSCPGPVTAKTPGEYQTLQFFF